MKYFIGTGQEISAFASAGDKYRFVMEQARIRNDRRVLRKLERFGEPDSSAGCKGGKRAERYVRTAIFRYAGYFSRSGPTMREYAGSFVKLYGKCYGAGTVRLLAGAVRSLIVLNAEMDRKDCISSITELPFPVLLISGEEDMICPAATAQRWFDRLRAPKKDCVIIKNASHMVNFEQPREWNRLLIGLLSESAPRDP